MSLYSKFGYDTLQVKSNLLCVQIVCRHNHLHMNFTYVFTQNVTRYGPLF